jgi:uncharacterized protein YecE (DUF72 family)
MAVTRHPLVGIATADRHGPGRWLASYAADFQLLELDWTARRLPSAEELAAWAARVPAGFRFHISAPDLLAGAAVAPASLPEDLRARAPAGSRRVRLVELPGETRYAIWERFRTALAALREEGRLAATLFRLPGSTRPGPDVEAALSLLGERLPQHAVAVELPVAWRRLAGAPDAELLLGRLDLGVIEPGPVPRSHRIRLPSSEEHVLTEGPHAAAVAAAYRLLGGAPATSRVPAPAG